MNPEDNPYNVDTKQWEAFCVGYERSLSGDKRENCIYDEPDLIKAFNEGFDWEVTERGLLVDGMSSGKIEKIDDLRKKRNRP